MKGLVITEKDIAILEDTELAGYRLERLISIAVSEIVGIPGAGSKIKALFFEPLDAQTCLEAIEEVRTLVALYEPNINLTSVSCYIQTLNSDSQGVVIEIYGELVNNKKSFSKKIIRIRDTI